MRFLERYKIEWIAWIVFAIVTGISIFKHEMWLDEWQAIFIARESHSWNDLWQMTSDEHHPFLWFVLLYITKGLGSPLFIPKLLHYITALGFAAIILFRAPFPKYMRIMMAFGYYMVFEYTIITRNYGLSVSILFAILALWQNRRQYILPMALLLFLLPQTTLYGALLTISLCVLLLAVQKERIKNDKSDLWLILSASVGVVLSYITIIHGPPTDRPTNLYFNKALAKETIASVYTAFSPIPALRHHLNWNSIVPGNINAQVVLSIFILIIATIIIWRNNKACWFWITYLIMHLLLSYIIIEPGYNRHKGYIFLAFIVCLWFIYTDEPKAEWKGYQHVFICALFGLQMAIGIFMIIDNLRAPFSQSMDAVNCLKANKLDQLPIYCSYHSSATSVAGYLGRPVITVFDMKPHTFLKWSEFDYRSEDNLVKPALDCIMADNDSAILFLNYNNPFVTDTILSGQGNYYTAHIKELGQFTQAGNRLENYYLYLVTR